MKNDLSAPLVDADGTSEFYFPSIQAPQVAKLGAVRGENDAAKRAVSIVRTEIEISIPGPRSKNPQDAPRDTASLPRVGACLAKVHTACHLHSGRPASTRVRTPGRSRIPPAPEAHEHPKPKGNQEEYHHDDVRASQVKPSRTGVLSEQGSAVPLPAPSGSSLCLTHPQEFPLTRLPARTQSV
jgi:hypothetical protein